MTAARKPNPNPDSVTTSARASGECGTTSPRPNVKNVVPLRYRSVTKPGFAPVITTAEPAPYCISPKPKTSPTAHTPTKINSEIARKNDGLERVPNDDQEDRDTRGESARSWNHVRHCTCLPRSMSMCEERARPVRIRAV